MATRIYCAGEILPNNDWRESFVPKEILHKTPNDTWEECRICLDRKVQIIYTGPYLVKDTHVGNHMEIEKKMKNVYKARMSGINTADLIFAFFDKHTSQTTLAELGYAKGKGKVVWLANEISAKYISSFVFQLFDKSFLAGYVSPRRILERHLTPEFNSPIGEMFWHAWQQAQEDENFPIPLICQYPAGRYYVDFACEDENIAIELDGHATHSSPDAIAYDRRRQREIEDAGWKVIRFGGKEITSNAYTCALEAHRKIVKIMYPE